MPVVLTAHSTELREPENKHWQWLVSNRHDSLTEYFPVISANISQNQIFTSCLSKMMIWWSQARVFLLYFLYIITGCCHNVPGCLTTADWPLSEILLSGRTGAGRATPGTPGQSPATPVIMQSWPGYLSHTVRVTHYVDTLWPARIMFHIPSSPWSNVQKTRSDFLLWAGSDGVASTVNPTPALSHFLQNNSFHVSNFQITSVTFQI